MNKTELIEHIATNADISKAAAGRALDATVEAFAGSLTRGDIVTMVGFGSFFAGQRTARAGRNPRPGDPIRLDAATGEVIWAVDMPYFTQEKIKKRKGIYAHYGPVLAGGRVMVVSSDGLLRAFDPTDGSLAYLSLIHISEPTRPY